MGIVAMKRVTVLVPELARERLFDRLLDLGVVHVVPLADAAEPPADLLQRLATLRRQRTALAAFAPAGTATNAAAAATDAAEDRDEAVRGRVERALHRRAELEQRQQTLAKEAAQARPWGEVTAADLQTLEAAGATLHAWRVSRDHAAAAEVIERPAGSQVTRVKLDDPFVGVLAVFGPLAGDAAAAETDQRQGFLRAMDSLGERLAPPSRPLSQVEADGRAVTADLAAATAALAALSAEMPALDRVEARLSDRLRLAEARAAAEGDEYLTALSGYCPTERLGHLRETVLGAGGALLIADPAPHEEPPIALRNGPVVRFFEPLLRAFQLPHYRETDPTLLIAPFMGIFFGFCLGDAGYGLVLFLLGTWARRRFTTAPSEANKALGLIQVLGATTILIGLLTGTLFGMALYKMPALGLSPEWLLFPLSDKPANFFYASLVFGVVQLSFGIVLQLVRNLRRGAYQQAISSLGWFAVLPGVAVWALADSAAVFLGALVLILPFNAPNPSVARRLGGGAWALYNVTGLFGDVMSYARIFGLGLSSGIIAQVVNIIAGTASESGSLFGYAGALLVLALGHTFNFAMAVIGSLVHPARLQFLEFFGKFFEGGGAPYRPLERFTKGG